MPTKKKGKNTIAAVPTKKQLAAAAELSAKMDLELDGALSKEMQVAIQSILLKMPGKTVNSSALIAKAASMCVARITERAINIGFQIVAQAASKEGKK